MNNLSRLAVLAVAVASAGVGGIGRASAQREAMPPPAPRAAPDWRASGPMRTPWRARTAWRRAQALRERFGRGPMLVRGLLWELRDLDLSASQRRQVRKLIRRARAERRADVAHPRYGVAVVANPGSPDYAKAVRYLQQQAARRIGRASALAKAIYQVLTPQQQRNLVTLLAARSIRMESSRERMRRMRERLGHGRRQGGAPAAPAASGSKSSAS